MSDATDRILDMVMTRLAGGVDTAFANKELLNATESFCARAYAWRHVQKVTVRANRTQTVIPLPAPECRILNIFYAGDASSRMSVVPFTVEGDLTQVFSFTAPNVLKTRDARDDDWDISIVAFLTARTLDAFPDELFERYFEGLCDGLLARLYAIPQRPWSSAQMARMHSLLERRAISEAYRNVMRGFAGPNWSFPQF